MTNDIIKGSAELSFNAAKETEMTDFQKSIEKHILELIEPYIDIDTNSPLDDLDPQVIAEDAIVHYADSEHIL